jgi:hypothetical protein
MIKEILTAAGLEHAQGRFIRMPDGTHAVYFDDVEVTGPDRVSFASQAGPPRIYTHDVTVELYEPAPDDEAELALEAEFDSRGLPWTKQDRYWLKDLQRYQVVYELSYTSKSR